MHELLKSAKPVEHYKHMALLSESQVSHPRMHPTHFDCVVLLNYAVVPRGHSDKQDLPKRN